MLEDVHRVALEGRWDEAIALNQQLIERSPRDAGAYNRLGRAMLALGRYGQAVEAYTGALRADPANLIARRNLQRLESLRHLVQNAPPAADGDGEGQPSASMAAPMPRPGVFIEEIGKTWVDELVNPAGAELLAEVLPSEQLRLEVEGDRVVLKRLDGQRLGEIEAKTAERVIALIAGGNRYEAYALGLTGQSLRVILREVYRDQEQASRVSFPRQITSRAYLRERDLLRQRDESDFFLLDDDDDEEDDAGTTEADEEEPGEPDAEPFIEDAVTVVEDEEQQI